MSTTGKKIKLSKKYTELDCWKTFKVSQIQIEETFISGCTKLKLDEIKYIKCIVLSGTVLK